MKALVASALVGLLTMGTGRDAAAAGGDEGPTLKGTWLVPVSPGFSRGLQRTTQKITMTKAEAGAFDSDATVEFFDVTGAIVLKGCATATGQRY